MSLKARLLLAIVALVSVAVIIQATTLLNLSVSPSTESMREASRDKRILQSVQTQEATSKSVSENVTRISEMAEEINAAAEQSNSAAEELARVAATSKELVARFKL